MPDFRFLGTFSQKPKDARDGDTWVDPKDNQVRVLLRGNVEKLYTRFVDPFVEIERLKLENEQLKRKIANSTITNI